MIHLATLVSAALSLVPSILPPADTVAPAEASIAPDSMQETVGVWAPVTSPWGWTATYYLVPGRNILICAGTGLRFEFWL